MKRTQRVEGKTLYLDDSAQKSGKSLLMSPRCLISEEHFSGYLNSFYQKSSELHGADGSQWRIQYFPEVGAPTLRGRQHTIFPKTA